MRLLPIFLLYITLQLVYSCSKEKLKDPNEELVGEWVLVKTFSLETGFNTSDELKKTKWKILSDGKLKIYKNGIRQSCHTWKRDFIIFLGQYIDSTESFEEIKFQAITINKQGARPFVLNGNDLLIFESHLDGGDYYFERKK